MWPRRGATSGQQTLKAVPGDHGLNGTMLAALVPQGTRAKKWTGLWGLWLILSQVEPSHKKAFDLMTLNYLSLY
jgi:hypothetical protein